MSAIKRLIDLTASIVTLILLSPVIAGIAIIIWLRLGRPVFFRQMRPGLNGEPFQLIKFRTMRNERSQNGEQLGESDRMTAIGARLRQLSLDELPEFLNVARGEMSLVGPRPLLMDYLPLYTAEQARRHNMRPGITGWAQVNGRNAISWEEKFNLDIWYIDHWTINLDIKILIKTIAKVIRRDGISGDGVLTMTPLKGTSDIVVRE